MFFRDLPIANRYGVRNEMMSLPITTTVAQLGDIVRAHTNLPQPKFTHTPSGQGAYLSRPQLRIARSLLEQSSGVMVLPSAHMTLPGLAHP